MMPREPQMGRRYDAPAIGNLPKTETKKLPNHLTVSQLGESEEEALDPIIQQFRSGRAEQDSAIARLEAAYEERPRREDFEPTKKRRFLAGSVGGLTGFSEGPRAGVEAARGVINNPYDESYQEWLSRTGALERQAGLEIAGDQRDTQGLAGIVSYLEMVNKYDPVRAAQMRSAILTAEEPFEEDAFARDQGGRVVVTNLGIKGRKIEGDADRASAEAIAEANRGSREDIVQKRIVSAERIAELNRNLRETLGIQGDRIPPGQQSQALDLAEDTIARSVLNEDYLDELFTYDEESGRYRLKARGGLDAKFLDAYKEIQDAIDNVTSGIMGNREGDDQFVGGEVGP